LIKLGFLGSGRGSNFQAIYKNILNNMLKAEAVVVISNKKSKMLEIAEEFGIVSIYLDPKSFPTKEEYDAELVKTLLSHGVELVILAGYMKILTPVFINAFPNKILNIHPSLLPDFKGLHPQQQALDAGVKVAGCTVHFVTQELDSGPIIIQETVPVLPSDDEDSLSERILEKEHIIYTEAIKIVAGEHTP
jgi:phosphoribosylglycinamide formyltransferase-1